jgi:hypothetical protein
VPRPPLIPGWRGDGRLEQVILDLHDAHVCSPLDFRGAVEVAHQAFHVTIGEVHRRQRGNLPYDDLGTPAVLVGAELRDFRQTVSLLLTSRGTLDDFARSAADIALRRAERDHLKPDEVPDLIAFVHLATVLFTTALTRRDLWMWYEREESILNAERKLDDLGDGE